MEMQPPDVPVQQEPVDSGNDTALNEHLHKMEIAHSGMMIGCDKADNPPYQQGYVKGYGDALKSLKEFSQNCGNTPVADAVHTLIAALKADLDFAWTYHCNIAMAFQDEGGDYKTANRAAARFMKNWADVDTTKSPHYFE